MIPRVDTAPHGVEIPHPTSQSLIGLCSYIKSSHPGEGRVPLQLRQPGDENGDVPRVYNRPVWCGNPSPTGRSLIGWGSYIEQAHPGEDSFPSPDQKFFHAYTPTTRRRKRSSPGSIPLRIVWKPQPHQPIADWLVFVCKVIASRGG